VAQRRYGNFLRIDLTTRRIRATEESQDVLKKYVGGSGYGAYLLSVAFDSGLDPFYPDNTLLFMTGPLTGTAVPTSGRHTVVSRSPLSGVWGESSVGGHWGCELRKAGYDGVVVGGKADAPVYIWISPEGVEIRDAAHVWGTACEESDRILRSETDSKAAVCTIGPAGENLVPLAGLFTDGHHARTAARGGLGAVAGSKNLKGLVARGNGRVPVHRPEALKESIKKAMGLFMERTRGLSRMGTAGLVRPCEQIGTMPIKNWTRGSWPEGAGAISGERLNERFVKGQFRCAGCPIGCGRVIELDGKEVGGPEYETLGFFGGCCLIDDLEAICRLNRLCNEVGIDTIEAGALVAFAMELYERGIISKTDTDGLELRWGNWEAAMALIRHMSQKEGFGSILGLGLKMASETLGGMALECAVHVKGLSAAAHDPRAFNSIALGYATSNRGACHLQAFSHIFERNVFIEEWGYDRPLDRYNVKGKAELVAKSQDLMALFDSLALCKFSLFGGITPSILSEWLNAVTGWDLSLGEFNCCGERIFNLKRIYNNRLGISRKDDQLPGRFLVHKRKEGGTTENLPPLHVMLSDYYEYRGWDEEGIPKREKLDQLGLRDLQG
jgi:aldehyde:ferredoxin oxidoreductase